MSNAYGAPPPQKKKTSPLMWVGLGCAVLTVGMVAFVAFIFFVVFAAMRSSQPYQDAVAKARNDVRVQEVLGTPIEPGMLVGGNIQTQNNTGDANLSIPLKGPKGKARVYVVGTKTGGTWTYTSMQVTPENGPAIDLLTP